MCIYNLSILLEHHSNKRVIFQKPMSGIEQNMNNNSFLNDFPSKNSKHF